MSNKMGLRLNRRGFLAGSVAMGGLIAAPAVLAQARPAADPAMFNSTELETDVSTAPRNTSSFRTLQWRDYFPHLRRGAILADTDSRAVHYWSEDESIYRLYPSSVPMSDELTRRGNTTVTRLVEGPEWRPTPSMLERNPEWPSYVGPGPDNPLGTHALHLGWQYYRIHGTHDTRKIGRRSSNGCIGLYNEHIAELYGYAQVGMQVLLI